MKSLIIYHSAYKNNTEKIARVLASRINADLVNLKGAGEVSIDNYNLIGFGSGVYRESMSPQLFSFVEKLSLKGKQVFVFSTSGAGMKFYNKKLINLLESKGAVCKGSFACKGSFVSRDFTDKRIFEVLGRFAEGHPNDNDFRKAERFIDCIIKY